MRKKIALISLALILLSSQGLWAQVRSFSMKDTTVQECKGQFFDSNSGLGLRYNHLENYTFTICIPGATRIALSFTSFCTEPQLDYMRFYDGRDTFATQIGTTHSGTSLPPLAVASSGYLTINFISDGTVNCFGWAGNWTSDIPPLQPPAIDSITASCNSTNLLLHLNRNIPCDSVYLSAFGILGLPGALQSTLPIGCVGDSTNLILLNLNSRFDDCGPFSLDWVYYEKDVCDSIWTFNIRQPFSILDCPLLGEITTNSDSVCIGDCIFVTGEGMGGDCNFSYNWLNGFPPTPGPHSFCPTQDSLITLDITDNSSPPNTIRITKLIRAFDVPRTTRDTMVCESSPVFTLNVTTLGGEWFGNGIVDSLLGSYSARRAGPGRDTVRYFVNGCSDSLFVDVIPIDAGPDLAACPGSNTVNITRSRPAGGYWLGPMVDSFGNFAANARGVFNLAYHVNSCTDTMQIHVDTLRIPQVDTVCRSNSFYRASFDPPFGTWSGRGVIDSLGGLINLWRAGYGNRNFIYTINGCSDTLQLYIKRIYAGPNRVACPTAGIINLNPSPTGGYWTHTSSLNSLVDTTLGTFDPSVNSNRSFTDGLIYNLDGCTDTAYVYVRTVYLRDDSLTFCEKDPPFSLAWTNTRRSPWNGKFRGTGVTDSSANGTFDPSVSGPGIYQIKYVANGCIDSSIYKVLPVPQVRDTLVCSSSGSFTLIADQPGGIWRGPGIIDSIQGIFNPALTGIGTHKVMYHVLNACIDSSFVTVRITRKAEISGLNSYYCNIDSAIFPFLDPVGGSLTGAGIQGNSFNPSKAGPGLHRLYYSVGSGKCSAIDSLDIRVGDSLILKSWALQDTLCFGNSTKLRAQAFGGFSPGYSFSWNGGQGQGNEWSVRPLSSGNYTVTLRDGCSDPVSQQIYLYVHDAIRVNPSTGPKSCYDSLNYATVNIASGKKYYLEWQTDPTQFGDTLHAGGGFYQLYVLDSNSSCSENFQIEIESWPYIGANFGTNPNLLCNTTIDTLSFIDLSEGGTTGFWDFGDGSTEAYSPGVYPSHLYPDSSIYLVTLHIENAGGCISEYTLELCVKDHSTVFIPTAFSPNADGDNDLFEVFTKGIGEMELKIYNRWGEEIHRSKGLNPTWDGSYQGKLLDAGTYSYLLYYYAIGSPDIRELKSGSISLIK